ncbi:MAG: 23S rRNA (guanosine(2251)-2'-O)-methyltransferase RlmB [Ignavibacteria bacterium]|nr:23S rRNA (guanosine(2251)-2'-O)-methyltransferase RlmB [Ignavibacteria bacterium]
MLIYGRKPVLEALKSRAPITKIYLQYGVHGDVITEIKSIARKNMVPLQELPAEKFALQAKQKETQGIIALRATYKTLTLDAMIARLQDVNKPFLIALDSIQDPHNVGAILRTAEAAGVHGVLLTKHHSAPLNDTVLKTSAGALEMMNICLVDNLAQALKQLQEKGYWVIGSSLSATQNFRSVDYNSPIVLIFGNEGKGMRPLIQKGCDFLVKIPMDGKINSLNVSVAAGIMMFEVLRSRTQE